MDHVTTQCQETLGEMSKWCEANIKLIISINYSRMKYLTIKDSKVTREPKVKVSTAVCVMLP